MCGGGVYKGVGGGGLYRVVVVVVVVVVVEGGGCTRGPSELEQPRCLQGTMLSWLVQLKMPRLIFRVFWQRTSTEQEVNWHLLRVSC